MGNLRCRGGGTAFNFGGGGGSVIPSIGQFYVNGSAPAGGNGSLLEPFQTIAAANTAIAAAGAGPFTVHVATGVYAEALAFPTGKTVAYVGDSYYDTTIGFTAGANTWAASGAELLAFSNLNVKGNWTVSDGAPPPSGAPAIELLNAKLFGTVTFAATDGVVRADFQSDYFFLQNGTTIVGGSKELDDSIGEWTVLSPVQGQNIDADLLALFGDPNTTTPKKVLIASQGVAANATATVKISTPIRMGSYQELEGLGKTTVVPTYASGDCIIIGQNRGAPPHGTAPTTPGQDYSVRFTNAASAANTFWFNAGRNGLRPTALTAFTIQWYMRPHTALLALNNRVFSWAGAHATDDPVYPAASFSLGTGPANYSVFEARMSSGAAVQQVATFTPVLGTEYEMAMTWDGSRLRMFANGTKVGDDPLVGTFSPEFFEELFWGPFAGFPYPEGGIGADCCNYDLGAWRVSQICRFTANYTPAAAVWVPDADDLISWVPLLADEHTDLSKVVHGASAQTGWMQCRRGANSLTAVTSSSVKNLLFNGAIAGFNSFGITCISGTAAIHTTVENCGGEEIAQLVDLYDNSFGSKILGCTAIGGAPRIGKAAPVARNGVGLSSSCSLCVLDTLDMRAFRVGTVVSESDCQARNLFLYQSTDSHLQIIQGSGQFSGINVTDEGGSGASRCAVEYIPVTTTKGLLNFEGSLDVANGTPIPFLVDSGTENVCSGSFRFVTAAGTAQCIKFLNPGGQISPVVLQTRPMIYGAATPLSLNLSLIQNYGECAAEASIEASSSGLKVGVLATDAEHGLRGGGTQHALATATVAGFVPASGAVADGNSGSAITIDFSLRYFHTVTLSAATPTLTFTAPPAGTYVYLEISQDSTGGRIPTFPGTVTPNIAVNPAASAMTPLLMFYDGTSYIVQTDIKLVASSISEDVVSTATSANIDTAIDASVSVTHLVQVRAEDSSGVRCTVRGVVESIRSGSGAPTVSAVTVTFLVGAGLTINASASSNNLRVSATNTMGFDCHMTIRIWELERDMTVEDS